jgi:hypothetical protein
MNPESRSGQPKSGHRQFATAGFGYGDTYDKVFATLKK